MIKNQIERKRRKSGHSVEVLVKQAFHDRKTELIKSLATEDIQVTKTYLPPIEEYTSYLTGIWEKGWVTNYGPLMLELQKKLKDYLGVRHLLFVNNGTTALQVAIKALGLKGEILTTPFSYVATTSSIVWEGCTPVFVDIHPETFCLNPALIEDYITSETTAILATHVYGNPCDVEAIEAVASKHQLKVIYDAAHSFDVKYKGKPVLNFGDISTLSFHATKLFHTIEGGAIITEDDDLAEKISYMINFGHDGPECFAGLGINCKNSELHAAMGLCVLPKVKGIVQRRRVISELYDLYLTDSGLIRPCINRDVTYNYAYYPILFHSEISMLRVRDALNANRIFPRRYFYPSLTSLSYAAGQKAQVTEDISSRILCLPLYVELSDTFVKQIAHIIRRNL